VLERYRVFVRTIDVGAYIVVAMLSSACWAGSPFPSVLDIIIVADQRANQRAHQEEDARRSYDAWLDDPAAQAREMERLAEARRLVDDHRRSIGLAPLPRSPIERRRQAAWESARAAREFARAGNCATVRNLDIEVRGLDHAFHQAVFVRDRGWFAPSAAIAACLAPRSEPTDLVTTLDRASIAVGLERVTPQVMACGERWAGGGTVKLRIEVTGTGTVFDATVVETPDQTLAACVVASVRIATFAMTRDGGSFTYPFRFAGETIVK